MSENSQSRSPCARKHSVIVKNRKRKLSENDMEFGKYARRDAAEIRPVLNTYSTKPLEDVTSSLNVEQDLEIQIIKDTRAVTPELVASDWDRFRTLTCYPATQGNHGNVPLPVLTWADRGDVWDLMCKKDKIYTRDPDHLIRHPLIQPRMRAILLDWLTEVSEVYKLHRETYYLAIDYMDRYLSHSVNLPKDQLQLTGITCLFIASKIEEIYPPKVGDFAYVTDGACTEKELLEKELVIVKVLKWDLTPITSISWLNTYLQLLHNLIKKKTQPDADVNDDVSESDDFVYPHYSGLTFVQVARLLDLCSLDMYSLTFTTSKLAASALCYLTTPKVGSKVSGYSSDELKSCCDWMSAFAFTVQEMSTVELKSFYQVGSDDVHNIQTHSVSLEILERAQQGLSKYESWRRSPPITLEPPGVLTPPKTDEKCCTL